MQGWGFPQQAGLPGRQDFTALFRLRFGDDGGWPLVADCCPVKIQDTTNRKYCVVASSFRLAPVRTNVCAANMHVQQEILNVSGPLSIETAYSDGETKSGNISKIIQADGKRF
jgi:hypothetical protein